MKFTIEVDTTQSLNESERPLYRTAAALLLQCIGELVETTTETARVGDVEHTVTTNRVTPTGPYAGPVYSEPPPPPPPYVPETTGADPYHNGLAPPPPSNVVQGNFPTPPPPAPPPSASIAVPSPPTTPSAAPSVAAVGNAVSVDVDRAGMPWDARIHQAGKSKKRDYTWKLRKGIDPAIVAQVTAELAARSLPQPQQGNVPVPPPPPPSASGVPVPPTSAPVPPPPSSAPGPLSDTFKTFIDKVSDATTAKKITAQKVNEICRANGCPNLMQLNSMPHLIEQIEMAVDLELMKAG